MYLLFFPKVDFATVHWDGKLLPNLTGKEKTDRLPIIVSHLNGSQLLGVPELSSGTGKNTADAVYKTLEDWDIVDKVQAACYDTTATNTGPANGAAHLLQGHLDHDLLQLPCRHHIYELVLKSAFTSKFGSTSGPSPPIFQRFKGDWKNIDQSKYQSGLSDRTIEAALRNISNDLIVFCQEELKEKKPRHDYEEFLQLCLMFLEAPDCAYKFRAPGAMSHARWMMKAIYAFKIYLFRFQFNLTATEEKSFREFLIFVVRLYVKAWFSCARGIEAPNNDMNFCRDIYEYRKVDKEISDAVSKTFCNHLWYLSDECIAFSLFDPNVSVNEKKRMASIITSQTDTSDEENKSNRLQLKPFQVPWFCRRKLSDFVTSNTVDLFKRYQIPIEFLTTNALT